MSKQASDEYAGKHADTTVRQASRTTRGVLRERCGAFLRDESGNYVIITAILMPVLIGSAGLGTEMGLWLYKRQNLQAAADAGAISAGTATFAASNTLSADILKAQATGVTATYGFVDGTNGASVKVNKPPSTGTFPTDAVEVIVSAPQARMLSAIWPHNSQTFTITARAVALATGGSGCTLSLNKHAASAVNIGGSAKVTLSACSLYDNSDSSTALSAGGSSQLTAQAVDIVGNVGSTSNITTSQGISTGDAPAADPYANVSVPPAPTCSAGQKGLSYNANKNDPPAPAPGSAICGGLTLNSTATLNLAPGIYYIVGGGLTVNGSATLEGTDGGVTLVFTSEPNYPYPGTMANIAGGATIKLTAPTSGPTDGIVLYGDPTMTAGTTFKLDGGSTQLLKGAVYIPKGAIDYAGGASDPTNSCTQLIGDTISFSGNSNLAINCAGVGTKSIGTVAAKLIQ